MSDIALPSYPQPFGSRKINATTHNGPAAYVAGGETVTANTFGWGSFDLVRAGMSFNKNNTGNYSVQVLYPIGQAANNNNMTATNVPTGSNSVKFKWLDSAGNEAANNTNLSNEFLRAEYIGG